MGRYGEICEQVPEPSVFNSLIGLCGKSGEGEYALRIFAYMKQLEVIPNSTTFRELICEFIV